jgi:hypothetical protein
LRVPFPARKRKDQRHAKEKIIRILSNQGSKQKTKEKETEPPLRGGIRMPPRRGNDGVGDGRKN